MDEAGETMRALVIDDEKNIRRALGLCLESLGCEVSEAANGQAALEQLGRAACDLAFLDLRLGNEDGLDLLPKLLAARPGLEVIVDHRLRDHRDRGRGDQARRPRLPAQAVHAGADPARSWSACEQRRTRGGAMLDLRRADEAAPSWRSTRVAADAAVLEHARRAPRSTRRCSLLRRERDRQERARAAPARS